MERVYIVYDNVLEMISRRNGSVTAPTDAKKIDESKLMKEMTSKGYILVSATIPSPRWGPYTLHVYIFSPSSKYTSETAALTKLVVTVSAATTNTDVMLISSEPLPTRMATVVDTFESDKVRLMSFTYTLFATVIPDCDAVAEHTLLTQEEIDELEDRYVLREHMRRIKYYDPPVAWLGGRSGDVIKIMQTTLSGVYPEYHVCTS